MRRFPLLRFVIFMYLFICEITCIHPMSPPQQQHHTHAVAFLLQANTINILFKPTEQQRHHQLPPPQSYCSSLSFAPEGVYSSTKVPRTVTPSIRQRFHHHQLVSHVLDKYRVVVRLLDLMMM